MTSRTRALRFVAAIVALLAVAFAASGCSTSTADAATVDNTHISRRDLTDELDDLVKNDAFVKVLEQQGGIKTPSHRESIDSRLAATWLSLLVQQVVIDREFDARHLKLSASERANARAALDSSFGGKAVIDAFPEKFRDELIDRQAKIEAVANSLSTTPPQVTEQQARNFYDQNKSQLFPCPSAKSVAHIVLATPAEAQQVLAQLQAGADFATIARQRSTDAATRQQGGVVSSAQAPPGCYTPGSSPQLDAAVNGATPNQPTGPVQTQSGYEVVLVKPYVPPTFEQIRDQLIATLQQQASSSQQNNRQAALNRVLEARMRKLHVRIDPRYGRWVLDNQGARVEPPKAPAVRDTRNKPTPTTQARTNNPGATSPTSTPSG